MTGPTRGPLPEGVRRTGGAWDPDEGPVYFLAANASRLGDAAEVTTHLLIAVNELEGGLVTKVEDWIGRGRKVFLDSGIFNLAMTHARAHAVSHDVGLNLAPEEIDGFDDLFERYVGICQAYGDRLWGYVELDQGGRENKIRTRARLEALGLSPIPVYHPFGDGWDYFDELAAGYDRICFGNVVQADKRERVQLLHTMWERKRHYPHLWVHVLGYTPNDFLYACPPNSSDSSTWLSAIRWPTGLAVRSMGRPVDSLPRAFNYALGDARDQATGAAKATHLSALNSASEMMNWRIALDRMAELTGSAWR